jgi:hypothetical protein
MIIVVRISQATAQSLRHSVMPVRDSAWGHGFPVRETRTLEVW